MQTAPSLAQAHFFSVLKELRGEGILERGNDREELEPVGDLSGICPAELQACRHIVEALGAVKQYTNLWFFTLRREEHGSL